MDNPSYLDTVEVIGSIPVAPIGVPFNHFGPIATPSKSPKFRAFQPHFNQVGKSGQKILGHT